MYQLFGHRQSGSSAVEIALCLCDVAYRRIDAYSTEDSDAAKELEALNPQKQVPTLQLPDGSVLTEAAAILIHLGLTYPQSKLLPEGPAQRAQAIRGLVYIAANCYTPIGIIDFPERWLANADEATRQQLVAGTRQRLYRNWALFADQFPARPFLSGAEPGALDILAAVITKWSGTREALLGARPEFYGLLERIDHHPRVAPVLSLHWPS
ncbi:MULTISPECIES: glutathione S-transferase family protein [unclassified Pseudomonas]|uniref:glutathione S-transferase family protein n=1 Tax=unclassified Pseudomonas TaxID=196821 RepID=UPI001B32679A|nr:glutathione S-transferase family protein [Pseudomonas sp. Tri1]